MEIKIIADNTACFDCGCEDFELVSKFGSFVVIRCKNCGQQYNIHIEYHEE